MFDIAEVTYCGVVNKKQFLCTPTCPGMILLLCLSEYPPFQKFLNLAGGNRINSGNPCV